MVIAHCMTAVTKLYWYLSSGVIINCVLDETDVLVSYCANLEYNNKVDTARYFLDEYCEYWIISFPDTLYLICLVVTCRYSNSDFLIVRLTSRADCMFVVSELQMKWYVHEATYLQAFPLRLARDFPEKCQTRCLHRLPEGFDIVGRILLIEDWPSGGGLVAAGE